MPDEIREHLVGVDAVGLEHRKRNGAEWAFWLGSDLNIRLHMLVLDGAYLAGTEPSVFRRIEPPRESELQALVVRLAERIGRALERQGLVVRDADNRFLALDPATAGAMADLIGSSITYRAAVGARAGQKVFTFKRPFIRTIRDVIGPLRGRCLRPIG
jgi:hypothetical protein